MAHYHAICCPRLKFDDNTVIYAQNPTAQFPTKGLMGPNGTEFIDALTKALRYPRHRQETACQDIDIAGEQ
jgi:hypothetical protein